MNGCHAAKTPPGADEFEVVVAHFDEDLSWLVPVAAAATVYVKGAPPAEKAFHRTISLPNIGREGHTFLHHIVTRYDTLADVTMFVQGNKENTDGSGKPHVNMTAVEMRDKALASTAGNITLFGSEEDGTIGSFNCWEASEWLHECECAIWLKRQSPDFLQADCTPSELWRDTFACDHPPSIRFPDGAFFAVRSETIRMRSRAFYEKLLGRFVEADHANPEIGHMVEKLWVEVFTGVVTEST